MVLVEAPIFTAEVQELLSDEEYAALQEHHAKRLGVAMFDKKLFERLVERCNSMMRSDVANVHPRANSSWMQKR